MTWEHNYRKRIMDLLSGMELPKGRVMHAHVYHDDWCAVYQDGVCNCNPDIEFSSEPPAKDSAT